MKKRINSCRKGKQGEREFAAALRSLGIEARRGRQFSGSPDSPDVVTDLPGIHFEIKRTELFNLFKAMEQAIRDRGDSIPVVAHRRNRTPWIVAVRLDDILEFATIICHATTTLPSGSGGRDLQVPPEHLPEPLRSTADRIGQDAPAGDDLSRCCGTHER